MVYYLRRWETIYLQRLDVTPCIYLTTQALALHTVSAAAKTASAAALTRKKKKYNDKIYQVGHPAGDGGKERIR